MGGAKALVHGGEVRINAVMVSQPETCNRSGWRARGARGFNRPDPLTSG